ncbi:tRNA (adenosine(37)-N6)-threonylcarbamoyltransferase complex dimerization subunit type 1 TsaB [Desulfurobacterium indicum]|uniref:tRNA (Adenosine(37)-N6)-threonylcarbamoyltransferase complex dimerization subunit type 1 TsaB n=1 Tax=Desulfurobacterium indicum TaxID=1914305 RepID=A0A1R1MN50_9BACT|nr:tRNA (adenosine(37)-N6)-threonylcarbamoyltransferase complex dimerization subunit type 1 TsaB [Desulfurobacterium indicum]OMH41252.1 tRNA (adenosine(37)-N6)-threonylcarbamoyltransferase complex dimerization subunit type 1 TsaB [Desulfurobacterium indicum]
MKILGVDTCLPLGSVALIDDKSVLLSRSWNSPKEHISKVFEALNSILGTGKNRFEPIDLIIFTAGPGSFTGIRICLSLAKAFKEILGNEKIGTVSTLEALSFSFLNEKTPVFVIMEGRKNKYYIYCRNRYEVIVKPKDLTIQQVIEEIENIPGNLIVTGNYTSNSEIGNYIHSSNRLIEKTANTSIALNAALYAAKYGFRNSLEPIYIRQPDAKPSNKNMAD